MQFPQIRDYKTILNILATALIFFSCSGIEKSENERLRRQNCKAEYIYRNHDDISFAIQPPSSQIKSPYPWEGNLPRITKEFFKCKGSPTHPPIINQSDSSSAPLTDCEGCVRHSLPIVHGQRGVYPILIDLLNFVQKSTNKRVVITSGHRCPVHNTYVDPSKENRYSRHQIGAEVDFYVQDMEKRPMEIIQLLMKYYQETPATRGKKDFEEFLRYEKDDIHLTVKPWYNKEVFIKYQSPSEGRNADNNHHYPYITVQVRFDRQSQERVVYDWKRANLGYHRD